MSRREEVAGRGGAARDGHGVMGAARRGRIDSLRGAPGRVARLLLVVLAGAAFHAAPAVADEQPSIVKAYGLDWIQRVRDDAWPQPKDQRPVICLLDTGVAITPDTPADSPDGPIVARLAIDGGSGLPQGGSFEHLHGTTMASVIAAPKNDWGTVGVFPQARIVSIRVTVGDAIYITPADMEFGARACHKWALTTGASIGSMVMAESRYDQRGSDLQWWKTSAADIAPSGGVFVAAAGNDAAAQALPPATAPNVLVVSAGDERGRRCEFAAAEPPSGLRGPGCVVGESAGPWPSGSSAATAAVGALLGAMAALQPEVEAGARLDAVRTKLSSSERVLNATAFGVAMGVLPESSNAPPSPSASQPDGPPASPQLPATTSAATQAPPPEVPARGPKSDPSRTLLWRPSIQARWGRGRLIISRRDAIRGLLIVRTAGVSARSFEIASRRQAFPLARRPSHVDVWAVSRDHVTWRSLSARVKVIR